MLRRNKNKDFLGTLNCARNLVCYILVLTISVFLLSLELNSTILGILSTQFSWSGTKLKDFKIKDLFHFAKEISDQQPDSYR